MLPFPKHSLPTAAMAPLRIVHLEDNALDRELVRTALADEAISCEIIYAASESEFATTLRRAEFDVILSDFSMPGYGGAAALALVQEECPEVPFLFVSGTIGEERAIETLKSGAFD